jgi:DNA-binding NtrC family response regulator
VEGTGNQDEVSTALDGAPPRVLVVDDEPEMRRTVARVLSTRGMDVMTANDGRMAMELLSREAIDVALIDLMMPQVGGFELLEELRGGGVDTEVIIMTAYADVETAVRAMHTGAYHFLTKPFRSHDEVVHTVSKATEHRRLRDRTVALERRLETMQRFGELIGNSARMREVYRMATGVAPTSSTVLILGESGTGKELTARAIHQHSSRAERPFVAVNCSAIPESLVESELFGHVRGAFTGATSTRAGLFEAADGGTIFLDEVGDLPPLAQVKVLRALQEGEIKRVGSDETRRVDTRVIAATNVDLKERIAQGRFREDLFYRLCVVQIVLPALRERPEDIPMLAYHFLHKYATGPKSDVRRIDAEAMNVLQSQPWPGNVRELENAIQHAVVFCKGNCISPLALPMARTRTAPPPVSVAGPVAALADLPYRLAKQKAVDEFDRGYFSTLLERTAGNVSEAARQAGLDRSNFRRAARKAGVGRGRRP